LDTFVDFFQQHSRRLAMSTNVLLVILMSLSVGNTALFFVRNLDDDTIRPSPAHASNVAPGNRERIDLAALDLFGRSEAVDEPQVVDAPATSLNLELQGVFTAEDPEESTAIVAERNKTGELFQIGDRLPGNAILNAVFDDHILIKRGNRLEKLMFSDTPLRQQVTTPQSTRRRIPTPDDSASASTRLQQIRERIAQRSREITRVPPSSQGGSSDNSIRDNLAAWREKIDRDPNAVLGEIGVSPVAEGEAQGYRIGGQVSKQLLSQAGLQEGDVILSVNDTPVGNVATDKSLVDQALAVGRVRVEVQRGTRKFFLTVPIH
jgi:general secretion pathway protein C